ncbi:hypothetical protein GB937_007279 [Aspergillus fischeri]|nr:hypothetical protein GB937_007279 [Aspergillus fischeri]
MDCNNGSCPRHHTPKAGTVPPRWFPSAEEPGKKDGQPARPSVVISAGKSEHEAITITRRRRTPQLAARHLLSAPANASDLSSSKLIFDVCRSPSDLLLRVPTTNSDISEPSFAQPLCARPDQSDR